MWLSSLIFGSRNQQRGMSSLFLSEAMRLPCTCSYVWGWTPIVSSAGADNIKKYWSRYYQGSQGVVFVLDSASSDEDLEAARNELHSALQHPQLCTLPFLILANHQDKPAARTPNQVPSQHPPPLSLLRGFSPSSHTSSHSPKTLMGSEWIIVYCPKVCMWVWIVVDLQTGDLSKVSHCVCFITSGRDSSRTHHTEH